MSTFCGKMREYECISIDRYDRENLHSTVFFLSHDHKDHTQGLDSSSLLYKFQSNNQIKLYCSTLTRDLLLVDDKYKHLEPFIIDLSTNEAHIIPMPDPVTWKADKAVTVTLIQAGHCPGSVMFLFEGDEGAVLYTGDFRLEHHEITAIPELKSGAEVKALKSLYIDTTFCVPEAFFIPTRDQSAQAVCELTREWITRSPNHMVVILHKANLGFEYLFQRLHREFGSKIHVSRKRYEKYVKIGEMAEFTTLDPQDTQIHACKWMGRSSSSESSRLPCGFVPKNGTLPLVRFISVSTMCFLRNVQHDEWARRISDEYYRVCYSFHCSYSEIRDAVMYLSPSRAYPSVIPVYPRSYTLSQMQTRLNGFLECAKDKATPQKSYRPLGTMKGVKRPSKQEPQQLSQTSTGSNEFDLGDVADKEDHFAIKRARISVEIESKVEECGVVASTREDVVIICSMPEKQEESQEKSENRTKSECETECTDENKMNESRDLFADDEQIFSAEDLLLLTDFKTFRDGIYGENVSYLSEDEEGSVGDDSDDNDKELDRHKDKTMADEIVVEREEEDRGGKKDEDKSVGREEKKERLIGDGKEGANVEKKENDSVERREESVVEKEEGSISIVARKQDTNINVEKKEDSVIGREDNSSEVRKHCEEENDRDIEEKSKSQDSVLELISAKDTLEEVTVTKKTLTETSVEVDESHNVEELIDVTNVNDKKESKIGAETIPSGDKSETEVSSTVNSQRMMVRKKAAEKEQETLGDEDYICLSGESDDESEGENNETRGEKELEETRREKERDEMQREKAREEMRKDQERDETKETSAITSSVDETTTLVSSSEDANSSVDTANLTRRPLPLKWSGLGRGSGDARFRNGRVGDNDHRCLGLSQNPKDSGFDSEISTGPQSIGEKPTIDLTDQDEEGSGLSGSPGTVDRQPLLLPNGRQLLAPPGGDKDLENYDDYLCMSSESEEESVSSDTGDDGKGSDSDVIVIDDDDDT